MPRKGQQKLRRRSSRKGTHTYSTVRKLRPKIQEIDQVLDSLDQSPNKHQAWLYENVFGKPVQKEYEYVECSHIFRCSWRRCDHMYGTAADVLEHIKAGHMPPEQDKAKGQVRCGVRGCQITTTYDKLLPHIVANHEAKPLAETVALQCPDARCPRVFVNSFDRDIHVPIAHPGLSASPLPAPTAPPDPNHGVAAAEQEQADEEPVGATQQKQPQPQPPAKDRGRPRKQGQQPQPASAKNSGVDSSCACAAVKAAKTCSEAQTQAAAHRLGKLGRPAQRKQTPQRQPQPGQGARSTQAAEVRERCPTTQPSLPSSSSQHQQGQQQHQQHQSLRENVLPPTSSTMSGVDAFPPSSNAVGRGSGHLLDMYPHLSTIWRNAGVHVLSSTANTWNTPNHAALRSTYSATPSTSTANANNTSHGGSGSGASNSTSGRSSVSHGAGVGCARSVSGTASLSSISMYTPSITPPLPSSRDDAALGTPVSQAWPVPSVYGTGPVVGIHSGDSGSGEEQAVQTQLSTCHTCGKQGKRLYKCITCERQFHKDCADVPIRNRSRHHRCQPCRVIKSKQWAEDASPFDVLDWLPDAYTLKMVGEHALVDAHPPDSSRAARWRLGHMSRS